MARKNKSCGHHFAKLWWDLSGLTVGFIVISTYTYIYIHIYNSPALFVGRCSPNGPVKWFFFMSFCKCCQISTSNDAYGHQKSSKKNGISIKCQQTDPTFHSHSFWSHLDARNPGGTTLDEISACLHKPGRIRPKTGGSVNQGVQKGRFAIYIGDRWR